MHSQTSFHAPGRVLASARPVRFSLVHGPLGSPSGFLYFDSSIPRPFTLAASLLPYRSRYS